MGGGAFFSARYGIHRGQQEGAGLACGPAGAPLAAVQRLHDLKVWPSYYEDLAAGRKQYEVRKADRDFQVGDGLLLREYDPQALTYTGRVLVATIRHMTLGPVGFDPEAELLTSGVAILGIRVEETLLFLQPRGSRGQS